MKLFFKIGFILLLILLLMIPNTLIQGLIYERQNLEAQTQREIAASWGPSQKIMGPILSIPYTTKLSTDDGFVYKDHILRVLPANLDIDVVLNTEERKKSIYKAILYNAQHDMEGEFKIPKAEKFGKDVERIYWDASYLDIGFSLAASIDEVVNVNWDGADYRMKSGSSDNIVFQSGLHTQVGVSADKAKYKFNLEFGINGSEAIKYMPTAGNTKVNMQSGWASPGFVGLPLPKDRQITDDGFSATWKSTEYNRPFKDSWVDGEVQLSHRGESFGVDLVQTVGHYQKNMRSAKYALLIISLSFLVFFFFETLKGSRIHPVQYIFIGLTLSIFYTLLLSLSEHIGFGMAYLIAASGVIGLISWYSKYILEGGNVVILTIILSCLYSYIFVLLQMEEFALLVGSIGLFAVLAISMYLSRNMDWYGGKIVKEEKEEEVFV